MNYHKEALKAFASNVCLVSSLTKEELNKLFEYLSEVELKVVIARYGLLDNTPQTLLEVGRLMDINKDEVRLIEDKAVKKLRFHYRRMKNGGRLCYQ